MTKFFVLVSVVGLLTMIFDVIREKRDILIASYLDKKKATESIDAEATGT